MQAILRENETKRKKKKIIKISLFFHKFSIIDCLIANFKKRNLHLRKTNIDKNSLAFGFFEAKKKHTRNKLLIFEDDPRNVFS